MDPSHVGLRLCGYVYQYVGLPNPVEDDLGYGERDGFEFGEGEVVDVFVVVRARTGGIEGNSCKIREIANSDGAL